MSNTTDQLGKQASEVAENFQEMGGAVRDAAQAKLGEVSEKAAEYCQQAQDMARAAGCGRLWQSCYCLCPLVAYNDRVGRTRGAPDRDSPTESSDD